MAVPEPKVEKMMSILNTILADAVKGVNWMEKAQGGTNNGESLAPLLFKVALDGFMAASGGGSLLGILSAIEGDLPALVAAFEANNSQSVPAPAPGAVS